MHMDVELLENMHTYNNHEFPNWLDIQTMIPSTYTSADLGDFAQSHEATKSKVTFADYHYSILDQLYKPTMTFRQTDTDSWARCEMHSIVFNLYSALDSLGYEINLAYQFNLKPHEIHIYHNHTVFERNCLRCNLNVKNDSLCTLLNAELSKLWFETFHKLRNQIVHKNLPVIQVFVGGAATIIKIPDDPTNTDPQAGGYSQNLEINQYCKTVRNAVLNLIESVYPFIKQSIRTRYSI